MTEAINIMQDTTKPAVKATTKSAAKDNKKTAKNKNFTSALDNAKNKNADEADKKTVVKKADSVKTNTDKSGQKTQNETAKDNVGEQAEKKNIDKQETATVNTDNQNVKSDVTNIYSINVLNTMLNAVDTKPVSTKEASLLAILQKNIVATDDTPVGSKANGVTDGKIVSNKDIKNSMLNATTVKLTDGQVDSTTLLSAQQKSQISTLIANADNKQSGIEQNTDLIGQNNKGTAKVANTIEIAKNVIPNVASKIEMAKNTMPAAVANKIETTQGQLTQLIQEFTGQTVESKATVQKNIKSDAEKGNIVNTINSGSTMNGNKNADTTILSVKNVDDAILKQMNDSAQQETANKSGEGNTDDNASFAAQLTKAGNTSQILTNSVQTDAQPLQQGQNSYDIGGQIIRNAQLLKGNENSQMVINLQPEHLGELAVKINVHSDGMVSASFHSDNAQVRNLIQASVVQLRQDLQDQGIKVDNINVYSGLGDLLSNGQNNGSEFTGDQKKSRYRINQLIDAADQIEESSIIESGLNQSNYDDDGIDYRI